MSTRTNSAKQLKNTLEFCAAQLICGFSVFVVFIPCVTAMPDQDAMPVADVPPHVVRIMATHTLLPARCARIMTWPFYFH